MDFDQTCIDTLFGGVSVHYLLEKWMDFDQTSIDTMLGEGKSGLDSGDLDKIFKVTIL